MPRKSKKRDPDYEPTGKRDWGGAIRDEAMHAFSELFPATFRAVMQPGEAYYDEKEKPKEPDPYEAGKRRIADPSTVPDDDISDLWREKPWWRR